MVSVGIDPGGADDAADVFAAVAGDLGDLGLADASLRRGDIQLASIRRPGGRWQRTPEPLIDLGRPTRDEPGSSLLLAVGRVGLRRDGVAVGWYKSSVLGGGQHSFVRPLVLQNLIKVRVR